jgi:HEAT repeat protein
MTNPDPETRPTPASYADFGGPDQGPAWLRTLIQFFAIPLLIVLVAVGIYIGVRLMVGSGPQTAAEFVQVLNSDTINRRFQAAFELSRRLAGPEIPSEFRDPQLVAALGRTLRDARAEEADPPLLAQQILRIFQRLKDPATLPYVRDALDDPEPWVRSEALLALGQLRDVESIERVVGFSDDPDPMTRAAALRVLASFDQVAPLPGQERDPTEAWVLTSRTREIALRQLGDPGAEDVRFNAALLLARADEVETALPVLKEMLGRAHLESFEFRDRMGALDRSLIHSETILSAIRAVARSEAVLSDPEVTNALRRLADEKTEGDPRVRDAARRALGKVAQ